MSAGMRTALTANSWSSRDETVLGKAKKCAVFWETRETLQIMALFWRW